MVRQCIILLCLFFANYAVGQVFTKTKEPLDTTRHWDYGNYNYVKAKTDGEFVHGLFQDFKNNKWILICYPHTLNSHEKQPFIDSLKFEKLIPSEYLEFGTIDNSDKSISIVIAIEKRTDLKSTPLNSLAIYKAWKFDKKTKKYIVLNEKKLFRKLEGYYLK